MKGTGVRGCLRGGVEAASRKHRDPRCLQECRRGEFVHAKRRSDRIRARIGQAREVECPLERSILAGSTVAADHGDVDVDALHTAEAAFSLYEAALWAELELQRTRRGRDAVDEVAALKRSVDVEERPVLRPVDSPDLAPKVAREQVVGCEQTGKHRHVVLWRWAAEKDCKARGFSRHPAMVRGPRYLPKSGGARN